MYQILNSTSYTVIGGAAPFDPSTITGYEMHIIAGSLDGSWNDGDTPTTWPDETGTYVLTPSNTPTLEKAELNGKSIMRFLGASSERYRDTSPLINWGTKFSVAYVVKDNSTGTKLILRDSASDAFQIFTRDSGNILEVNCSDGTVTYQANDTSPAPVRGNWWVIIFTCDFDTGALSVYLNSDSVTASDTGSAGSAPTDSYIQVPADTSYPDADVAELIVYNGHIFTSGEVANLNDYFFTNYAITHS